MLGINNTSIRFVIYFLPLLPPLTNSDFNFDFIKDFCCIMLIFKIDYSNSIRSSIDDIKGQNIYCLSFSNSAIDLVRKNFIFYFVTDNKIFRNYLSH